MARNYKSGTYIPTNQQKYIGKSSPQYRSSWEHMTFKWLDFNPDVVAWTSEGTVIPYMSEVDGQIHRYFIDLTIKYKSGNVVLVEIKPKSQAQEPKASKGKSEKTLLEEAQTWSVNQAKWKAAAAFANRNGAKFQVWTEDVLLAIGIPIMGSETFMKQRMKLTG